MLGPVGLLELHGVPVIHLGRAVRNVEKLPGGRDQYLGRYMIVGLAQRLGRDGRIKLGFRKRFDDVLGGRAIGGLAGTGVGYPVPQLLDDTGVITSLLVRGKQRRILLILKISILDPHGPEDRQHLELGLPDLQPEQPGLRLQEYPE